MRAGAIAWSFSAVTQVASGDAGLWYFAYGANMARAVLARRQVRPTQSHAARVDGYTLRFNHPGAPPLEPVFANIEPRPGAAVYGVAHRITPEEAAVFDSLEPGYRRVALLVEIAEGATVEGFAYMSDMPARDGIPSARYLELLIDGAREFALPDEVIASWEELKLLASTVSSAPLTLLPDALAALAQNQHVPADLLAQWQEQINQANRPPAAHPFPE